MAVRFQIGLRKSQETHDGQTVARRIEFIRQQSIEMNKHVGLVHLQPLFPSSSGVLFPYVPAARTYSDDNSLCRDQEKRTIREIEG